MEALLRWQHPQRGPVPPAEFIPLAEQSDLIVVLGAWVLETACAQMAEWRATGPLHERFTMSVNLSARQLADDGLVEQVRRCITASDLDPAQLYLEVTETGLLEDMDASIARLHALRRLGVKVALDDFGTGYSSLTYLRALPVDLVKIDRAFIWALPYSPQDDAIVSAVVSLAHTLGKSVLAEGVETAETMSALERLGCDFVQGYHLARPLPPDEVVAVLTKPRPAERRVLGPRVGV